MVILKEILGKGFDVATSLGEKLGEVLNDVIDEVFPQDNEPNKEKGGEL